MRNVFLIFAAALSAFGQTAPDSTDAKAWRELEHGIRDANPIKRQHAVLAMAVMRPDQRTVALLEEALRDKDSGVREGACLSLGEMNARAAIPKLQEAIADSSAEVVFAAAKALYKLGDPSGRQVMSAVLLGEQADASGFVKSSVRSMKLKLHDPKALLMIGVNSSAGLLGPFGMGVPVAEGLMKDNQATGKTVAALLLATDRTPGTLDVLKQGLSDKNWAVRAASARAIAMRDAGSLYGDVMPLLEDKRTEVTYSGAASLIRLGQGKQAPRKRATKS